MKYLKTVSLLFTAIVFLSAQTVIAQHTIVENEENNPIETQERGINFITKSAYEAISYNGYTISEINATEGNEQAVQQQLWGTPTSVEEQGASSRLFKYGNNRVMFNTDFKYATNIIIKDNQWTLTVQGQAIRVGDTFSSLQQKFTEDLKIRYVPMIGPEYLVFFDHAENAYDGVGIYFNPETHRIQEIRYFVNP